jgi:hypothetical protein
LGDENKNAAPLGRLLIRQQYGIRDEAVNRAAFWRFPKKLSARQAASVNECGFFDSVRSSFCVSRFAWGKRTIGSPSDSCARFNE